MQSACAGTTFPKRPRGLWAAGNPGGEIPCSQVWWRLQGWGICTELLPSGILLGALDHSAGHRGSFDTFLWHVFGTKGRPGLRSLPDSLSVSWLVLPFKTRGTTPLWCARGETVWAGFGSSGSQVQCSALPVSPWSWWRGPEAGGLPTPRALAAVPGFASLLSRDDRKCQSQIFTGGKVWTLQIRFSDLFHCGQLGTPKIPASYVLIAELILGRWTGASSAIYVFKFPLFSSIQEK